MSIIALSLVVFLYTQPYVLLFALAALSGVWMFILKDKAYLYVFGVAGVGGSVAEVIAIHAGAWSYAVPQFAEIPVWLPVLWGLAGMFVVKVWEYAHKNK